MRCVINTTLQHKTLCCINKTSSGKINKNAPQMNMTLPRWHNPVPWGSWQERRVSPPHYQSQTSSWRSALSLMLSRRCYQSTPSSQCLGNHTVATSPAVGMKKGCMTLHWYTIVLRLSYIMIKLSIQNTKISKSRNYGVSLTVNESPAFQLFVKVLPCVTVLLWDTVVVVPAVMVSCSENPLGPAWKQVTS